MASQPPPESYVFAQFKGLRNTIDATRLSPTELVVARNVDLDDAGQLRRRRGYGRKVSGRFHSLFTGTLATYGVKNGELGLINRDYSFIPLGVDVGTDSRVAYVQVADDIYFSSGRVSGVIRPSQAVDPWGQIGGDTMWVSPVVNPTAGLTPIRGKLFGPPPMATVLGERNGRIYLGEGRTLWATELYLPHQVDKTRNFLQFEDDITGIGMVNDGLYVGTRSSLWFLSGTFPLKRDLALASPVIAGSMVAADPKIVAPQAQSSAAVLILTESGLICGLDGGVVLNLTHDMMLFPQSERAAAMFRRQDGGNHYIVAQDSAGTPISSARVGDYCDAEIRRFQGG